MLISKKRPKRRIFVHFCGFFSIFRRFLAFFCGFLGIFGRFYFAYYAQTPQFDKPTPVFTRKTLTSPKENPQKPCFFLNHDNFSLDFMNPH
jgi:hypothetical protein